MARTMERPKPTRSHLEQQLLWAPGCRRSRASPGPGREEGMGGRRAPQGGTRHCSPAQGSWCHHRPSGPESRIPTEAVWRGWHCTSGVGEPRLPPPEGVFSFSPKGNALVCAICKPHTAPFTRAAPRTGWAPAALPPCPGLPGAPAAHCPPARHGAPPLAPLCPSVTRDVPCPCRAAAPRASPPTGREPWASSSQPREAPVLSDVTGGYAGPGHPGETLPQAPRSSSRR